MALFSRLTRRLGGLRVYAALLASVAAFGVLLYSLPPAVVEVCLGVGVVGLVHHALLSAFERRAGDRPWPLSALPDWLLFVLPAGGIVGLYLRSHPVSPLRAGLFCALLVVCFYFWYVLPAAWYHKVRSDREGDPDPPESSLTVLVPAYNEEACLGRTLDSLTGASYPGEKEILVVDDGSTDATYETALAHVTDEVTVLRKPNGGKDSALNYGLEWATGDAVVTVDADSVVAEDALERIVADLEVHPNVGAVGGTVRLLHTDSLVETLQALEYAVGLNTFRRAFAALGTVNVVPGCLGCFRREALESVGGYDGDTLTEDYDLTLKLLTAGWEVRASEAVSYTEAPSTWRDLYRQRVRWTRGNVESIRKHAGVLGSGSAVAGTAFSGIVFPFQVVSLVVLPVLTAAVLGTVGAQLATGHVELVVTTLSLFALLQTVAAGFALALDGTDLRLLAYAPASILYQYFVNAITLKSVLDVALGTDREWTRVARRSRTDAVDADDGAVVDAGPTLEAEVSDD